jgi:hypothetical protein
MMDARQSGVVAAAGVICGVLASGPLAVALVEATHPQPAWHGASLFARSYHPVQLLPYAGGLVLVAALVLLVSSLHAMARPEHETLTTAALVLTAAFTALIVVNYVIQTTFVPELARSADPVSLALIGTLSMANPRSLAWAIEMWGWGLLGVATWLLAPVFGGSRLERATAVAFVANGVTSVTGTLWTVAQPGWVMSRVGLGAFALWNVLLATAAALALASLHSRRARAQDLPEP